MSIIRVITATFSAALYTHALIGCAVQSPPLGGCEKIVTAPGPEDVAVDKWAIPPRIIISTQDRRTAKPSNGALYEYAPVSGNLKQLFVDNGPFNFMPHGIHLVQNSAGKFLLYAVNHHTAHTPNEVSSSWGRPIETFELNGSTLHRLLPASDPSVHIPSDEDLKIINAPNDVVATPEGDIYVTNMHGGGWWQGLLPGFLGWGSGSVVRFRAAGGYEFVAGNLNYPNGIFVQPMTKADQHERLLVTLTMENELREYSKNGEAWHLTRTFPIPTPDNISGLDDGSVLIASHNSKWDFALHTSSAVKASPWRLFRFGQEVGLRPVLIDDNAERMSGASVGMLLDEHYYVGQVFGTYLLSCKKEPSNP